MKSVIMMKNYLMNVQAIFFKYRYYICQESYNQVKIFKDKIPLIHILLSNKLNFDLKNFICMIMYHIDIEISCIVSKEKEISRRLAYLNYSFDNFTLNQLKILTTKRNDLLMKTKVLFSLSVD